MKKWANEDGSRVKCSKSGCDLGVKSTGLCSRHYVAQYDLRKRPESEKTPCPVPECGRPMSLRARHCKRCIQFAWRYSLTLEQVVAFNENRICGNTACGSVENLHMDHDHACCVSSDFGTSHKVSCGKCVRGWLCRSCNLALGYTQEDPRRIEGLLRYLEVTQ